MGLTIYGHSDDLIEIEGDVSVEFSCPRFDDGTDQGFLAFSDGTILRITYTNEGIWRIGLVAKGAGTPFIVQAPENDEFIYSDICTLEGDYTWVVLGTESAHVVRK